jgi:hypothetical protein
MSYSIEDPLEVNPYSLQDNVWLPQTDEINGPIVLVKAEKVTSRCVFSASNNGPPVEVGFNYSKPTVKDSYGFYNYNQGDWGAISVQSFVSRLSEKKHLLQLRKSAHPYLTKALEMGVAVERFKKLNDTQQIGRL